MRTKLHVRNVETSVFRWLTVYFQQVGQYILMLLSTKKLTSTMRTSDSVQLLNQPPVPDNLA